MDQAGNRLEVRGGRRILITPFKIKHAGHPPNIYKAADRVSFVITQQGLEDPQTELHQILILEHEKPLEDQQGIGPCNPSEIIITDHWGQRYACYQFGYANDAHTEYHAKAYLIKYSLY
jgi:hypothetical protein